MMVMMWLGVALLLSDRPTTAEGAFYTCEPVNASAIDSFCRPLLSRLPKATCVDAAGYRKRSKHEFEKQHDECSSEHKKKEVCPHDPGRCHTQVFTYEEYCGVYDQSCETDADCLAGCYADCFPCNTRSNCDILESFGVIAPEGSRCFSPFNHSVPTHS